MMKPADGAQGEDGPLIRCFDVANGTTAAELASILEDHCGSGFYVAAAIPWPEVGVRLVLRRYKPAAPKAASAPPKPTKEDRAMTFLQTNIHLPATQLSVGLKAIGYPRSADWVREKQAAFARLQRSGGSRANL